MKLQNDISSLPILAEGGEGIIHVYNGSQLIKEYKPSVNLKSKETKIKALIAATLPKEVVAPTDIVYDHNGRFIGYVMDKIEGEEFKKLVNKKFISANNITTKELLKMLTSVQDVLISIHNHGIYIGDLNDQNILFDKNFDIHFIDCDSWTIGAEKCDVAMDLFKDPLLVSNNFNAETDIYSFSVLVWKILTRIHPFGGTMDPDMNIVDRMKRGIPVINHPEITIPRTIKSWNNLSPGLISTLEQVFLNKSRILNSELSDMLTNLTFCKIDKDYYYNKFTTCPLCDKLATIQTKPISQGVQSGLQLVAMLNAAIIKMVMNTKTFLDVDNNIVDIHSGKKIPYQYGVKYYFDNTGKIIESFNEYFIIHSNQDYRIEKKYKTDVVVEDNHIYYISQQNTLMDATILNQGNSLKKICKCSNNVYFEVDNGNYCIFNYYEGKSIVNINGMNHTISYNGHIVNYGIHHDRISDNWLIILEDITGKFTTFVFGKDKVIYTTDQIKYTCSLANVCFSAKTLFIPIDEKIRGFSYEKNIFKDFECTIVNGGSKLIKKGKQFVIINDENIYTLS